MVYDVTYSYHASDFLENIMCPKDAVISKNCYSDHCPEGVISKALIFLIFLSMDDKLGFQRLFY